MISAGILPRLSGISLPTGTPVVVYGFLQGGIGIAIFQLLLIGLWIVGYYPFFKSLDNDAYKEEMTLEENTEEVTV